MWSVAGWDVLVRSFWGMRLLVLGMWMRLLVGVPMGEGDDEVYEGGFGYVVGLLMGILVPIVLEWRKVQLLLEECTNGVGVRWRGCVGVLDKSSMVDLMVGRGFSRYRFLRHIKEVEHGLRGVGAVMLLLVLSLVGFVMAQFFGGAVIAGLSWGVGVVVLLGLPIYFDLWGRMARVEKSEYVLGVLSERLEEEVAVGTKQELVDGS